MSSPNWPAEYGDYEDCVIEISGPGSVSATTQTPFETESCCDHLTIGESVYSGTTGPSDVVVDSGTGITWHTDGSVHDHPGFQLCVEE